MSEAGISRRQFVGGAAAVAAATALPAITAATPAFAGPADIVFPLATPDWTPLDAKAAARVGYEIYRGKYANPASAQGG